MANNSGSHRTGTTRDISGKSRRGESYSERYNRPNPYTGYLPPGVSAPEEIYHPESVDPVRVKQLEREQEQARLRAHEEKAALPDSPGSEKAQNSAPYQQRMQVTRSQVSRGSQGTTRRTRQTRRAQVAQQQAARAGAAHRAAVEFGGDAHLNEIRQSAIDEAEKLRSQSAEVVAERQNTVETERNERVSGDVTVGLPVAGAAQFAAMDVKTHLTAETEAEESTAEIVGVPVEAEMPERKDSAEEQPNDVEITEPAESEAESAVEATVILADLTEQEKAEPEQTENVMEKETAVEEAVDEEGVEEICEEAEKAPDDELTEIPEETAEVGEVEKFEEAEEVAEPEEVQEETAVQECETEETEVESVEEIEDDGENDDDIKVYIAPEKAAESNDETDDFDEDYYEYEDEEAEPEPVREQSEDVVTEIPTAAVPHVTHRRSFETRISPELADSSAYSPGVAQDETLFIRKKRPEDATAVFAATTPGIAPELDDDDFFEQWLEEGDDMIIKDKRQRRRASAIIGGATMIFAIIGFIFVVVWFIKGIPGGSSSAGTQTDYASFILPVVNADPEPFETISSVDNNVLVEAAINRLTYGEAAADHSYTALEVENETRLLIPSADVEESGKALFGEEFAVDYANMYTIEDEKIYYYSAADDSFHVITTSGDIEPEIIKISHIGSRTQVLLEVGYLSTTDETADDSEYYKKMEYVLNAVDGGYYVSAVRAIEDN